MKIVHIIKILVVCSLTVADLVATDWIGKYRAEGGGYPTIIEIRIDHTFTQSFPDGIGYPRVDGIWREHEGRIFLLERKSKDYSVYSIMAQSDSGQFTIEKDHHTVIDMTENFVTPESPEVDLDIVKLRMNLIKMQLEPVAGGDAAR